MYTQKKKKHHYNNNIDDEKQKKNITDQNLPLWAKVILN